LFAGALMMLTRDEICAHVDLGMATRRGLGSAQHDDHVWRWLNWALDQVMRANPIRIRGFMSKTEGDELYPLKSSFGASKPPKKPKERLTNA
jgi:hypothetical protein